MTDTLVGTQLGNFQIISPLGQGGMARVYKARDLTLNRLVAIKVVEPSLKNSYTKRFRKEAQAIASLEHPHIIPVYYFNKQATQHYMAMRFIEGEDLSCLMDRYAKQGEYLPLDDILHVVEAIGSALDYAHSKGVIHRDVKPSNIMVDQEGHPYLTDFGLALDVNEGTVGEVFGSPHYLAPEQARNSAETVPQSDLYSLGVMLYELFTGVVPFDDTTPTAIALKHIMVEPPSPRALNPNLPPQIEAIILKSLAKKPEDRYQSGSEMHQVLSEAIRLSSATLVHASNLPPLPPLPPGITPPPPRQVASHSIADAVKLSLAERPAAWAEADLLAEPPVAPEHQQIPAQGRPKPAQRKRKNSPKRIFLLLVAIALACTALGLILTQQDGPILANLFAAAAAPTETISATSPTSQAASATPITPAPATAAATTALTAPTAAPENWLPVHFVYNREAFYWLNDSNSNISSESISFQQIDGSKHFEGNHWIYQTMEVGRCMEIVFIDATFPARPQGCRPNAFFMPSRTQGADFWTGDGQFQVLWNNQEIAVCDSGIGECNAFVPTN